MGTPGCVSFMFEQKGVIVVEREGQDEDKVMEDALEAGAADFQADDDVFEIYTEPEDFSGVREDLQAKRIHICERGCGDGSQYVCEAD